MKIPAIPFTVTDLIRLPKTVHPGETGGTSPGYFKNPRLFSSGSTVGSRPRKRL